MAPTSFLWLWWRVNCTEVYITIKFPHHHGAQFTWTLGCIHLSHFLFHSSLSVPLSAVVKSSITHKRSFIKADRYGGRLQKLITFQCLEPLLSVTLDQACFPPPETPLPAGSMWSMCTSACVHDRGLLVVIQYWKSALFTLFLITS